ncbi:discoidin domain-containing protein [Kitasatospora sp. NBC_01539]
MAQGKPATSSSSTQNYGAGNVVDGNADTYWESANNAFPQTLQVDLGCALPLSKVTLKLPPASSWATRTETLAVQGSTDGNTFSTLVGSAGYTFNPATGNTVTITLPATPTRFVRLSFTGNTGWPAGQLSEFQVFAS